MAGKVKQSIKNVKQSIGNDSDMDFDLELDWSNNPYAMWINWSDIN